MKHIPDFMYRYLEESIDAALSRTRPIPDCPEKHEIFTNLEKCLSFATYLRKYNDEIGGWALLPSFSTSTAVMKRDVTDVKSFEQLIKTFDLVIRCEEDNYYILEGSEKNIGEFMYYWN